MNVLAELNRILVEERREIEYWRNGAELKSIAQFETERQARPFASSLSAPTLPNKQAEEDAFWNELVSEVSGDEPHPKALYATIVGAAVVLSVLAALVLTHLWHIGLAILAALILGGLLTFSGLALTARWRYQNIIADAEENFDVRFSQRWSDTQATFERSQESYDQSHRKEQAQWQLEENKRIANLKALMDGDVSATKIAIERVIGSQSKLALVTLFVSERKVTSICLQAPDLSAVVNAKSKKISEKSGKLINRTKPKEEREADYATFAAGSALSAIVDILNAAPGCLEVRIALCSDQRTRKAFHVAGCLPRKSVPRFDWHTVDPVALLSELGFHVHGGKAKKDTRSPEWLKRLDAVRIDTAN